MTGIQLLRFALFALLPIVSGVAALLGQRRKVTVAAGRRSASDVALTYGPVAGATLALTASVILVGLSAAAGH